MEEQLNTLKERIKDTPGHLKWKDLDQADRFTKPPSGRKRLLDTVRMIACRAQSTLCSLLGEAGVSSSDGRRILQDLFNTEVDLAPEPETGRLRVRVHRGARPAVDRVLEGLFAQLNEAETVFPGTDLVIVYELVGSPVV